MSAHVRTVSTDLPGEGPVDRWTPARKEEVLRRIREGEITRGQALRTWKMSIEELESWRLSFERRGREGLKATEQRRLL